MEIDMINEVSKLTFSDNISKDKKNGSCFVLWQASAKIAKE